MSDVKKDLEKAQKEYDDVKLKSDKAVSVNDPIWNIVAEKKTSLVAAQKAFDDSKKPKDTQEKEV